MVGYLLGTVRIASPLSTWVAVMPERRRLVPVDLHVHLGFLIWRSLVHVLEAWRSSPQLRLELGCRTHRAPRFRALERQLVQTFGQRSADTDRRRVLGKGLDARYLRQERPELLDDLIHMEFALGPSLSFMKMRPWFPEVLAPPAPTLDMKPSTSGSCSTIEARAC